MVSRSFETPPPLFTAEHPLFNNLPHPPPPPPPPPPTPGILITLLVLSIAIILTASFYLLLRLLRRSPSSLLSPSPRHSLSNNKTPLIINSLPLFPFSALSSTTPTADCAVCLSTFQPTDLLRLLPLCRHAFHQHCIDPWLSSTPSCPLCRRSPLLPSTTPSPSSTFRVDIGTVSSNNSGDAVFSLGGSFHYVVDDESVSEIHSESMRWQEEVKLESTPPHAGDHAAELAAEVGQRGGWLKDFLSRSVSSSRTASFRGSSRWFCTGSSRRTATELPESELDVETSRLGDEIGELFRCCLWSDYEG